MRIIYILLVLLTVANIVQCGEHTKGGKPEKGDKGGKDGKGGKDKGEKGGKKGKEGKKDKKDKKDKIKPIKPFEIAVPGEGIVNLIPTLGTVTFAIQITDADSKIALSKANKLATDAIAKLNTTLATDKQAKIETGVFQLQLTYDYSSGTSKFVGYAVTNQVLAKTTQLTLIGDIITAGVAAGLNRVDGINYSNTEAEISKANDAAMNLAIQQAEKKAALIAADLKLKVQGICGFSLQNNRPPPPFEGAEPTVAGAASTGKGIPTPIYAQQQNIRVEVNVNYKLDQEK